MSGDIRLFALHSTREFGEAVSRHLGVPLSEHEERNFEDGEHKSRPLVNVRNRDAFVVHSLYGEPQESADDKLCRLIFFIGALVDGSAARVTALVPYLCYARKDRKTQPRDPITSRYVARLLEASGVDRVVTLDVHNLSAFQNAFRCRTDHLEARKLFVHYFANLVGERKISVVSPDVGGIKRAEQFREALARVTGKEASVAFMEKQRSGGAVTGEAIVGDLKGRTAIIVDDLVSTGTTISRAVRACAAREAAEIYAAATHGIFVGQAGRLLSDDRLEKVVVTDSIPPFRLDPALAQAKLVILSVAPLFAEAIQRIHSGGSLVELLQV